MLTKLPIYFTCFFSNKENKKVVYTYKIEATDNHQYPFQLLRLSHERNGGWENLSIYGAIKDSVGVLLKELFDEELSDELYQGRASIDPISIMEKLDRGERLVSVYDESGNVAFHLEYDIPFESLVKPRRKRLVRKPENY